MYVKKIKIFENYNYELLEDEVNDFLSKEIELGFTVIDIKYQKSMADDNYSCLVYYTEPVKED
jgi:hypothetical protein